MWTQHTLEVTLTEDGAESMRAWMPRTPPVTQCTIGTGYDPQGRQYTADCTLIQIDEDGFTVGLQDSRFLAQYKRVQRRLKRGWRRAGFPAAAKLVGFHPLT